MARMSAHGWGTALIFARTETRDFFAHVWEAADGLLFLEGRLSFHHADGRRGVKDAGAPSVLCAYGADDLERLAACGLKGRLVPLRLPRSWVVAAVSTSWRTAVLAWVQAQPGPVAVDAIYRAFAGHPKARRNRHWKAKVRQTLQLGPFERVDRGVWRAA